MNYCLIGLIFSAVALAMPCPVHAGARRSAVRIPAEWETHAATWMQWPYGWEASYRENFAGIIKVLQAYEPVHIIVTDQAAGVAAANYLTSRGVPLTNISLRIAAYDNAWMRDNGPVYAVDGNGLSIQDWGFNGWGDPEIPYAKDNDIPRHVAEWLGVRRDTYTLINERGTLEFNGVDTLITSWAVLHSRNPGVSQPVMEQILKDAFGVTSVVWLTRAPSDDMTGGHVDGIARFISTDTVAVARSLIPGDGDAGVYEDAADVIAAAGFTVVRLDIPGTVTYGHPALVMAADYMNWLVANGVVVMTGFNKPEWDKAARAAVAGFFPGRDVVVVDTRELWYNGGGVHCVTNDQPASTVGPTPPPTPMPSPAPQGFSVTLSSGTVSPGGRLVIGARVPALREVFDAWAVALMPTGEIYSLMPGKAPVRGAAPLARSVNGLWADIEVTLFDGLVPAGMPGGTATVAAGIFHPGTMPGSPDDARRQAIAGYYDQKTVTIAQ